MITPCPESRYTAAAADLVDRGITSADLRGQALADPAYAYLWTGLAAAADALSGDPG